VGAPAEAARADGHPPESVYDPNVHAIVWQEGADAAADQIDLGEVVE
jgi:hypothetical protein